MDICLSINECEDEQAEAGKQRDKPWHECTCDTHRFMCMCAFVCRWKYVSLKYFAIC